MKTAAGKIVGKTIAGIIVKQSDTLPRSQVFLIFDDDTYYEFYSDLTISGAGGIDEGGAEAAKSYLSDRCKVIFEASK